MSKRQRLALEAIKKKYGLDSIPAFMPAWAIEFAAPVEEVSVEEVSEEPKLQWPDCAVEEDSRWMRELGVLWP